ncbi:hypothetical protein FS837_002889 [Tulasnella sp. UAMH 9824]|nr:hypothetical protein FS837_002889 [Tulasnella sp. UAMH 9824]
MQEDAETILNLLLLLYPTSLLYNLGPEAAIKLAKAYDKYLIPKDRLRLSVLPIYHSESALESSALRLYRMAWELDMIPRAKIASRYTRGILFKDLHAELPLEPLEKLIDLRRRREKGLDSLIAVASPKTKICLNHGWSDEIFFQEITALKNKRIMLRPRSSSA